MKKEIFGFKVAFQGIFYAVRTEAHMRFHLAAAVFAVIFAALFQVSTAEWGVLILTITAVLSLELINTALERLCNLYTKEKHPVIKAVKDVAAGAVLTAAAGSIATGCFIFLKPQKIQEVFFYLLENPVLSLLLLCLLILGILFVSKGGRKKNNM